MDKGEDLKLEGGTGKFSTATEGNIGTEAKRDARKWKCNIVQLAWSGSHVSFVLLAARGVLVRGLVFEKLADDLHACCSFFSSLGGRVGYSLPLSL